MQTVKLAGKGDLKPILCAALSLLVLIITGCSGAKTAPGQPFVIPFDSSHITTKKTLSVSASLSPDGSSERDFKTITQQHYYFESKNCTAEVRLLLNRKATVDMPKIGDWSTVSLGNCLSNDQGVKCYTAHIDCHLVRMTFIPTGKRSLAVIRVRNRAREPQELCEQWDPLNLSPDQEEEVNTFNRTSDSMFIFK
ncbi:hypothetical protein [Maridesulfovibrio salexigens]|uniref:Lipoprotein n=1 Tax=Maridesulfovibrio salexigens (strain ATCC 14822 / DSM 2638 / NCIMB 8403 / VKM B-1763) TaxID=526222 RepID=C6BSB6_MARSD|nr:hypothetical protein [Maridesulfovibrio salexigens]ACS79592.1 hypothetical protein Desal_1530 [Maridesulfovibrio salexigens DSM 2638]